MKITNCMSTLFLYFYDMTAANNFKIDKVLVEFFSDCGPISYAMTMNQNMDQKYLMQTVTRTFMFHCFQ